jgi:ribosomal protein S18 acetylase RimI-like enzyme
MSEVSDLRIVRAGVEQVELIAPLFDAYRQFYEQAADAKLAHDFIAARLENNESVIFLASGNRGGETLALGFTQLFPTFCSVSAKNVWILGDLFVAPVARRLGVAKLLMTESKSFGEASGSAWMQLQTAYTNQAGQALYESLGWVRDEEFYTYSLSFG